MAVSIPPRAPYAENFAASRGRKAAEPESRTRTPFARDRDRIIHATAFRRLKEKTQVFVAHEDGDEEDEEDDDEDDEDEEVEEEEEDEDAIP